MRVCRAIRVSRRLPVLIRDIYTVETPCQFDRSACGRRDRSGYTGRAMIASRRRFLQAAAAAPALGAAQPAAPQSPGTHIRDSSFDPWVEVQAANLRHNVAEIHKRVGQRPILAVIKNNGYGAGVVNVA